MLGLRHLGQHHGDTEESDGHQHGRAEKRSPPRELAEQAAGQRAHGEAESEGRLVEDDRSRDPAGGGGDDRRESGGDEERVAQAPASAQPDDRVDVVGHSAQTRENDDEADTDEQRVLRPDAARHPAGEEHADAGDEQVARKQQHCLARRGVERFADLWENRIDQSDAHKCDRRREGDGPYRPRLLEKSAGARLLFGVSGVDFGVCVVAVH